MKNRASLIFLTILLISCSSDEETMQDKTKEMINQLEETELKLDNLEQTLRKNDSMIAILKADVDYDSTLIEDTTFYNPHDEDEEIKE